MRVPPRYPAHARSGSRKRAGWASRAARWLAGLRPGGRQRDGVSMWLPAGGWWLASPNGRGDVLLTRVGEIYDIWPAGSRHIGGMLAANARTQRVQDSARSFRG